jgi:hypothetical protein
MAFLCSKINAQKYTCATETAMHLWIALGVLTSNTMRAFFHTKLYILELIKIFLIEDNSCISARAVH